MKTDKYNIAMPFPLQFYRENVKTLSFLSSQSTDRKFYGRKRMLFHPYPTLYGEWQKNKRNINLHLCYVTDALLITNSDLVVILAKLVIKSLSSWCHFFLFVSVEFYRMWWFCFSPILSDENKQHFCVISFDG